MAIALVGTPTIADQNTGATLAINYPAGHATGHVGYCALVATFGVTVTATGWTQLLSGPVSITGWAIYIFRRVLDGSEGASVSFTATGNNIRMINMRLYSGVNNTTPEDTAGANPQGATAHAGQPNVTGFTTNQSGDELLFFCFGLSADRTYTTPTSWGNASLNSASANGQASGSWDLLQSAAGAIGAVTTGGGTTGDDWVAALVAVQVAAALVTCAAPKRRKHKLAKATPLRYRRAQNPSKLASGFPVLFSAVHPLRGYPLRADKPIPRKFRPIQTLRRRVTAFNILVFYFTAPRHLRPHKPAVIKRWKRMNPRAYSATAALLFWALARRTKPRKQIPPKLIKRRWWRRLGAMAVAGSPTLVAFIKQRRHRPFPQAHSRMPVRTRRASSGAGLLFMLAAPRRSRKKLPLKLPLVIGAPPMKRYRRIGGGIAALFFFVAVPRRRRHLPRPEPVAAPPPWKRRKTIRERYVAFVAAVGATLDAIVNWRSRGGY